MTEVVVPHSPGKRLWTGYRTVRHARPLLGAVVFAKEDPACREGRAGSTAPGFDPIGRLVTTVTGTYGPSSSRRMPAAGLTAVGVRRLTRVYSREQSGGPDVWPGRQARGISEPLGL